MSRLLDLFCGAGGCARGYMDAGFEVVGVDIKPQPRFIGQHFIQADALELLTGFQRGGAWEDGCGHLWHLSDFAAIHASPPCQGYSIMNNLPWLKGRNYPLLILPTLEFLERTGKPYVLENVMGARYGATGLKKRGLEGHGLKAHYLCGAAFGLPFYRHRLFAANWLWLAPAHPKHELNLHPRAERYVYGGMVKGLPGGAAGIDVRPRTDPFHDANGKGWKLAAKVMGINWMNHKELTQAIPPVYTRFIGDQLQRLLKSSAKTEASP